MSFPLRGEDLAADVLHRLNMQGVRIDLDDNGRDLSYAAPPGILTDADLAELRRLKPHVRRILETVALFDLLDDDAPQTPAAGRGRA